MKTVFIKCAFAFVLFLSVNLSAQTLVGFQVGLKGSMPQSLVENEFVSPLSSLAGGVVVEHHLKPKISVQSGILLNDRGYAIQGSSREGPNADELYLEQRINYVDLPLALNFQIGGQGFGLNLRAGGIVGYAFNGKVGGHVALNVDGEPVKEESYENIDFETEGYSRINAGVLVGTGLYAGIGQSKLFLDVNTDIGLTQLDAKDPESQFFGVNITAGVAFKLGKK